MRDVALGICWALAMLLVAVLQKAGWMDRASAVTLFTIIPGAMIAAMGRSCTCDLFRARKGIAQ